MATKKSNQSTIALLVTGIIILAALSGYLWFDRTQLVEKNEKQQEEIMEVEKIQAELEIQYEEAMTSLDEMKTDNIQLNKLIDEQKSELASQKKKINDLIWTQRKYNEAKAEIEKFKTLSAQYVAEIETLTEENQRLNARNVQLVEDKNLLIEDLETEKQEKEKLEVVQAKLVSEKSELEEEKSELEEKVNIASVINVDNVVAQGIKTKSNGKEVAKKRASQIEKLRVCFDTESNLVADRGQEVFYVRIIDPQGETMAIEAAGSGVITKNDDGASIRYSKKGILSYENEEVTACIDWAPGMAFSSGNYELEVYNKGYLAGSGQVNLK